jgi:23S rRNA pseudouridine1911/1915/1917 synthase
LPFILKKYKVPYGKKIQLALIQDLNLHRKILQKYLSRGRIFDSKNITYKISDIIKEEYIYVAQFQGSTKGLKPLLIFKDFAIFDKPSNLMVHPISKNTTYSLLDEIRYHFGQNSNLAHRIDAQTSGLVLVSLNKNSETILKKMFEQKKYKKSYLAFVKGKISKQILIDKPITKDINSAIGVKMTVSKNGKISQTIINPIKYYKNTNQSLIEAIPLTGRQHQIRVHLNHINHTIIGDPIYGVNEIIADQYLCKKLTLENRVKYTGHSRLLLHSNSLEFKYKDIEYKIYSKMKLPI